MSVKIDKDASMDFEEFCGAWSKADLAVFEKETVELRTIDPGDWE